MKYTFVMAPTVNIIQVWWKWKRIWIRWIECKVGKNQCIRAKKVYFSAYFRGVPVAFSKFWSCMYSINIWLNIKNCIPTNDFKHVKTTLSNVFCWKKIIVQASILLAGRIKWYTIHHMHTDTVLIMCAINSSPPSAAYMHQWIGSALVLNGAKPLSKPMPGYCQLGPQEQTLVKF